MTDSVAVEYEVVALERIERGSILAVADVLIRIEGVELLIKGATVRRDGPEHVFVSVPCFRHPRSGEWRAAFDVPPEIWDAVSVEITEVLTGRPARLVA